MLKNESGRKEKKRFYRCLFRLRSKNYLERLNEFLIKETGKGIYEHLRHSMAHIYFPMVKKRKDNMILFIPSMVARDGFTVDIASGRKNRSSPIFIDKKGWVVIATRNYANELEEAVENFYRLTFIEKRQEYQTAAAYGIDIVLRGKN